MARGTTKAKVQRANELLGHPAVAQMERAHATRERNRNAAAYERALLDSIDVEAALASPVRNAEPRIVNEQGYVLLWMPLHPKARNGRILEHRVVMERKLGRFLEPGENVHHLNGIRDDNRPENLELWTRPQPTGVRIEDSVEHALDVLRRHAPHLLKDGA